MNLKKDKKRISFKFNFRNKKKIFISVIGVIIISVIILLCNLNKEELEKVSYKDFSQKLDKGEVKSVLIEDDVVKFNLKENELEEDVFLYYTDNPKVEDFKERVLLNDVIVYESSAMETMVLVFDILFYGVFFGAVAFAVIKFTGMNNETFKVVKHTNVKFDDIAGMDELKKEMIKIVDILKNPEEYYKKGIRQIKGIILEGAPGNGKTLFAKALAEEANVNFIATKGADFQSAIMSMGARKIKSLFKKARKHKPCIIFIDEFDSIGERRYYAGTGVDKENNRIVTAMLNEMDGFIASDGILVIAATNSYNSLDAALIRPGRFDLKYNIPNPDQITRIRLIEIYTKEKNLDNDINIEKLAESFDGLSSAAIEAIINEATMISLLEKSENITVDNIINASKRTNCNINIRKLRVK